MKSTLRALSSSQSGAIGRRLFGVAAVLASLALLWTGAIGWALPHLLKPRLETAASEALGAPFAIERLEIAPWTLQATVAGLRLGPAEAPWLRVAEILVDVSSESVWRLAPVIERLRVSQPEVDLERIDEERFNVSPMLDALRRRPPSPEGGEPARFALHNLKLEGGRIHLIDRVSGSEHRIEALQVGVPFISNLASGVAVNVEPLLDAVVNGSRLALRGHTLPFSEGLRSSIDIDWQQIDLPVWLRAVTPLLTEPLPVAVQQGRVDLALRVDFERLAPPRPPSLRVSGGATLSGLKAALPAQGTTLALEKLVVGDLDLRPAEHQVRVGSVGLQSPLVEIDLPRLLGAGPKPGAPSQPAVSMQSPPLPSALRGAAAAPSGQTAWQSTVDAVQLTEGLVSLRHPAWPKAQRVALASIDLKGLDSRADAPPATLAVQAGDERGAAVRVDGTLGLATRQLVLKTQLTGFKPVPWLAPWSSLLPVRLLEATLAAEAEAETGPAGWAVRNGALQLTGLRLQPPAPALSGLEKTAAKEAPKPSGNGRTAPPASADDQLNLPRLSMSGVQLRADEGQALSAQVESVRLDGLALRASRDEHGVFGWVPAPKDGGAAISAAPATPAADRNAPGAAPAAAARWQLGELRCSGCSITLSDRAVAPAAVHALTRTELSLRQLSGDMGRPINFDIRSLAGLTGQGGKLLLRGELRPQPLALKARIEVDALDLSAAQRYLEPFVNLTLTSAKLSADGNLRVDGDARQPVSSLGWKGRVALAELRTLDKINDAELLRFKRLGLDGMDLRWTPAELEADLGQIALEDFYSRVILNADGRINLSDIVRRGDEDRSLTTPTEVPTGSTTAMPTTPATAPAAPAAAASTAAGGGVAAVSGPPGAAPHLRWSSIRLVGGGVDFTDNFIKPNYSVRLTDMAGEVSALAWNDPQPAKVQISGKVDGSAPLEIGGSVHPLGARLDTDITASARGVDITRLTAYAARYAGYGIDKGTLSLKVRYKIANGKLEAENNLYLDQLTFGAAVDSPNALKLPIQLAVALLKDRNGVIDLNLPISGSLDDPQFSVGGIIVKVIVNLITKAITAPFALLGNLFGGGSEELGFVEFDPGSSALGEAAIRRLDALAKALADRPALKLEATGRADAAQDEAALRAQHLDRLMRNAKAKSSGDLPDSVKIEPAERARWLEAAYKAADLKDKPRNLVGLAKSIPPADMEALLLASAATGEPEIRRLANQRGDRVKAYLVTKVAPERVLLTASKLGAEGITDEGLVTRVAFSLK